MCSISRTQLARRLPADPPLFLGFAETPKDLASGDVRKWLEQLEACSPDELRQLLGGVSPPATPTPPLTPPRTPEAKTPPLTPSPPYTTPPLTPTPMEPLRLGAEHLTTEELIEELRRRGVHVAVPVQGVKVMPTPPSPAPDIIGPSATTSTVPDNAAANAPEPLRPHRTLGFCWLAMALCWLASGMLAGRTIAPSMRPDVHWTGVTGVDADILRSLPGATTRETESVGHRFCASLLKMQRADFERELVAVRSDYEGRIAALRTSREQATSSRWNANPFGSTEPPPTMDDCFCFVGACRRGAQGGARPRWWQWLAGLWQRLRVGLGELPKKVQRVRRAAR